jgi:hypothetical protein
LRGNVWRISVIHPSAKANIKAGEVPLRNFTRKVKLKLVWLKAR